MTTTTHLSESTQIGLALVEIVCPGLFRHLPSIETDVATVDTVTLTLPSPVRHLLGMALADAADHARSEAADYERMADERDEWETSEPGEGREVYARDIDMWEARATAYDAASALLGGVPWGSKIGAT